MYWLLLLILQSNYYLKVCFSCHDAKYRQEWFLSIMPLIYNQQKCWVSCTCCGFLAQFRWKINQFSHHPLKIIFMKLSHVTHRTRLTASVTFVVNHNHNPAQRSCWGFVLVSLPRSIHPSVCPFCILCPLCSDYSFGWIHFIFIHLIKQLQKVCRV